MCGCKSSKALSFDKHDGRLCMWGGEGVPGRCECGSCRA